MISLDTINQINDIMRVLNNTKSKLNGTKPKGQSFSEMVIQAQNNPVKHAEIAQTIVKPDIKLSTFDTSCCVCGEPGKYMIKGRWYCEEHKDVQD